MKALILAAGYGNRMLPLTENTNKTLLKIGAETIIERIINSLCENNIFDITIVTGYKAEKIKTFLENRYDNVNFQFIHNENYLETNNIVSMALAVEQMTIDEDIILVESDLIYEPKVIEKIIDSKHKNVALVDKYKNGMDGTVVELAGNVIKRIIPAHLQNENFDFSDKYKTLNIYKFSKDFCNNEFKKMLNYYIKNIDKNCYYELVLGTIVQKQTEIINVEIINDEKWIEVDNPNDLKNAEFIFCPEKRLEMIKNSFGGYWNFDILDFNLLKNMHFPDFSVISEIKNNLPSLMSNYGSKQSFLNEKLSYFSGYKKENLQALNGASQIYPILNNYFSDKKIIIPEPTFGEYARIFPNANTYNDCIGFDLPEIKEKIKNNDVIVFVNPNNPTGSEIPTQWIYDLAKHNEQKTVIIDESFIEFSKYDSIIPLLEKEPLTNIIVIKSLSKSLGVPGVRLGYSYSCNQSFNEYLFQNIPIWNMNSIAENMLEILLKHKTSLKASYKKTIEDREILIDKLKMIDFVDKVFESGANFVLAKLDIDAKELVYKLLTEDMIYLKDVSAKFNDNNNYIRVAVRSDEDNERLINAMKKHIDLKLQKCYHP